MPNEQPSCKCCKEKSSCNYIMKKQRENPDSIDNQSSSDCKPLLLFILYTCFKDVRYEQVVNKSHGMNSAYKPTMVKIIQWIKGTT